ncbi:tRNA(Ile)-lysidine synthase [Nymphon striatum]|nr:tRNA(Ile)-lysidine synthase [Nymphon striatum]
MDAGEWAIENASKLSIETLLTHGTADQIIDHKATQEFHQNSNNTTLKLYEAARELRYAWFAEIMQDNAIDTLVTAHHADDNLETFVINLSRGTGIEAWDDIEKLLEGISGKEVRSKTHRLLKDREYLLLAELHDGEDAQYAIQEGQTELETPFHMDITEVVELKEVSFSSIFGQTDDEPVLWSQELHKISDTEYELVMTANIADEWHIFSQFTPEGGSWPSEFKFSNEGVDYDLIGATSESETTSKYEEVFGVEEVFFLVNRDVRQVDVKLSYQACKEVCIQQEHDFKFVLDGGAATSTVKTVDCA